MRARAAATSATGGGQRSARAASTARRRSATAPATRAAPAEESQGVRVLRQFRIVFNAVKTHFQQVERRVGLGGAQVWALSVIRDRPGIGVNDLAAALNVRQPTASNLVRGLVELELVEARREAADRRQVQLYALPGGRQLLRKAPGPLAGVLPAALERLPPQVLARMEKDLAALIEAIGADQGAGMVPLATL
jgi:DNA-binding MarR family transcriptional regulator